MSQVMALSYSRLSDYRQCPLKFKLKYIIKAPNFQMKDEDKSPALVRGGNIHKQLEKYLIKLRAGENGIPASTLEEVEKTKPLIQSLMRTYDLHPELQLAIDKDFKQVDWFSKEAWFRVIYDLVGFGPDLYNGDYKTGKLTDYEGTLENPGQLHLSGMVALNVWPKFDVSKNRYIYVDHKKIISCDLTQDDAKIVKEALMHEHNMVNTDTQHCAKSNRFCGWCDATKEQCMHSKK